MSVEQALPPGGAHLSSGIRKFLPTLQLDTCVGWIVPALAREAALPSLLNTMTLEEQVIRLETASIVQVLYQEMLLMHGCC